MAAGEGLLARTVSIAAKSAKVIAEEVAKRLGKPVAVKKRAALRAAKTAPIISELLKRDPADGITPLAAARTRAILTSKAGRVGARTRTVARTEAKGAR